MKTTYLLILTVMLFSCGKKTDREYLAEVLENMDKVKSVKYHCINKTWEPGDKNPVYNLEEETYEHINLEDTAIGYSYLIASDKEFKQPLRVYDGTVHAYIDKEEEEIRIDDFTQKSPLPFRMIMQETFYYMKSIIGYALTTKDSITISLDDLGEDYLMELTINMPNQVEFFGKARYMPQNPYIYDPISIYKIWISKENDMPYRFRREMQHNINEKICSSFAFNPSGMGKIIAEDYYPEGYGQYIRGQKSKKPAMDMTGKAAPDWTLTDMDDREVSLSGIKSKVVLLQLTGIGCGPCKISIPFLNKLRSKYDENDLEIIAVETWKRPKQSCETYIRNHGIKYKFLTSGKENIAKLINDYQAGNAVPQFYVIGKNRTITKICKGYSENTTDKEIKEEICNLIKLKE